MTLYERIETLRKMEKISQGKLEAALGFSNGSISKWKNSAPTMERLNILATHFGVSVDFLYGNTDSVTCPECGFCFMPLSEQSVNEHRRYHEKFKKVKEKCPFFIEFGAAEKQKNDSIFGFRNPQFSMDDKIAYFDKYLQAAFSIEIINANYECEHLDYCEFCRIEVETLKEDSAITREFIIALAEKYGASCSFDSGSEEVAISHSRSSQLMRIMAYAERLNPEILNSLEIQIKALAEQSKGSE